MNYIIYFFIILLSFCSLINAEEPRYHKCLFQIYDIVEADCPFDSKPPIIGVVTKIQPKPTNEGIHLITVRKRLSGRKSEEIVFSEQYLTLIHVY